MHRYYKDILSRISEQPKWFDEYAVPRYCDFEPNKCANIYTNECALVLIQCQACHHKFQVCFSEKPFSYGKIWKRIQSKEMHYGDPPNIECCAEGLAMTSESIRVLEYWKKVDYEWVRNSSFEINLETK